MTLKTNRVRIGYWKKTFGSGWVSGTRWALVGMGTEDGHNDIYNDDVGDEYVEEEDDDGNGDRRGQ